jgi:hypothetical protein
VELEHAAQEAEDDQQASMSEINPQIRALVDYLLGDGQPPAPSERTAPMFDTRVPQPSADEPRR